MKTSNKVLALAATAMMFLAGGLSPAALAGTANATGAFDIDLPGTVSLVTLAGNANDTFPAMTVTVSPTTGVATGSTSLTWKLITNALLGANVKVYLPNLVTPDGCSALGGDLKVKVSDGLGIVVVSADGGYASGVAVSAIPTTSGAAEAMFHTILLGTGHAVMTLDLSAAPEHGSGHITGTLTMIATTN